MDALCRVFVYRADHGWTVDTDTRSDGAGKHLAWAGGLVEHYLKSKRHPKTMHEIHLLLHGCMGSVPDEVEVVFDDYGIAPVRRSDMPHLAHHINFGAMEDRVVDVYAFRDFLDGVNVALDREKLTR